MSVDNTKNDELSEEVDFLVVDDDDIGNRRTRDITICSVSRATLIIDRIPCEHCHGTRRWTDRHRGDE